MQNVLSNYLNNPIKLSRPVRLLLAAQALDLISTVIGLALFETRELHPAGFSPWIVAVKALAAVGLAAALSRVRSRLAWLVPGAAGLAVAWNTLVLSAEIFVRLERVLRPAGPLSGLFEWIGANPAMQVMAVLVIFAGLAWPVWALARKI